MIQHKATIHLNRPVEQVFSFVLDHHNLRMWQSNLIESEQLTDEPMRVGTRLREVRRLGRRPSEIQAETQPLSQTDASPRKRWLSRQ